MDLIILDKFSASALSLNTITLLLLITNQHFPENDSTNNPKLKISPNTPRFKLPIIAFSFTKIAIIKVRKNGIQTMNINHNIWKPIIFLWIPFSIKHSIKLASRLIKGRGRILVRKSGTESKIRVMGESDNKALLYKCVNIIVRKIK